MEAGQRWKKNIDIYLAYFQSADLSAAVATGDHNILLTGLERWFGIKDWVLN